MLSATGIDFPRKKTGICRVFWVSVKGDLPGTDYRPANVKPQFERRPTLSTHGHGNRLM
jgi:hypothetical protein